MKPFQFKIFEKLLSEIKPLTVAEIGVHSGNTARQLISYCLKTFDSPLHYTGYDAFDLLIQNPKLNVL